MWPTDADALVAVQRDLAVAAPVSWTPPDRPCVGACWACFARGLTGRGSTDDAMWVAALTSIEGRVAESVVRRSRARAPYTPGLLALRLGPAMAETVEALPAPPDVLLLDATARDHPRGAGLALHLGAELGLPTVGVTHRPLRAEGPWPADRRGATSPLTLGGHVVACWLRTRPGTRPVVVHPGWRVDLDTAMGVVTRVASHRTPEPLRKARQLARRARAAESPG